MDLGSGPTWAALWVGGALQTLPIQSPIHDLSASGQAASGGPLGFRWRSTDGVTLISQVPGCSSAGIECVAVNADGEIVMGVFSCPGPVPRIEPFRWTQATGVQPLGLPTGAAEAGIADVSHNGQLAIGTASASETFAFRWSSTAGFVELPGLPGHIGTAVARMTQAGDIIVGRSGDRPVRWVNGMCQDLGVWPGSNSRASASDIAADGRRVVGNAFTTELQNEPFIWDAVNGLRLLRDILGAHGVGTSDWQQLSVSGISGDGTTLAGWGRRPGSLMNRPWHARIPAHCYANCDGSTVTPTLNVADFTCFLRRFASGDVLYADCDLNADLGVPDFTCFLRRFAAGCP